VTRRPVRIDQVMPSIVERDAVSRHALEAQQVLRSMGFVSEIYACTMGAGLFGRAHLLAELPRVPGGSQWLCYQSSIGSPAADAVLAHPGPVVVNYHNITPPELVEHWMPSLGEEVRLGRAQLAALASVASIGIAVSEFNKAELDAAGYNSSVVAPLMSDSAGAGASPDPGTLRRLEAAREGGGRDWLFVGQMLPHKAHHDVVKALACARSSVDPDARLHLVGRESCPPYVEALRRFVRDLGLEEAVCFAGSVSAAELAAYFEASDVFVCCSDHEGFCAPLIEALHHELPVVAYGAAAVPETLVDAGLVLTTKEPVLVAAAVDRVTGDDRLRARLIEAGSKRAMDFTLESARSSFRDAIELALYKTGGSGGSRRETETAEGDRGERGHHEREGDGDDLEGERRASRSDHA